MKTVDKMIEQLANCIIEKVVKGDYKIITISNINHGIAEILIDEKHKLTLWVREDIKEIEIWESSLFKEHLFLSLSSYIKEDDEVFEDALIHLKESAYKNFQNLKKKYLLDNNELEIKGRIKDLEKELQNIQKDKEWYLQD